MSREETAVAQKAAARPAFAAVSKTAPRKKKNGASLNAGRSEITMAATRGYNRAVPYRTKRNSLFRLRGPFQGFQMLCFFMAAFNRLHPCPPVPTGAIYLQRQPTIEPAPKPGKRART